MKRIFCIFLCLVMLFATSGCKAEYTNTDIRDGVLDGSIRHGRYYLEGSKKVYLNVNTEKRSLSIRLVKADTWDKSVKNKYYMFGYYEFRDTQLYVDSTEGFLLFDIKNKDTLVLQRAAKFEVEDFASDKIKKEFKFVPEYKWSRY